MESRKRKIKGYLESTNKSVINSESPWNDCKQGYFFCRHLNGSVRVHGPSVLTVADSIMNRKNQITQPNKESNATLTMPSSLAEMIRVSNSSDEKTQFWTPLRKVGVSTYIDENGTIRSSSYTSPFFDLPYLSGYNSWEANRTLTGYGAAQNSVSNSAFIYVRI